LEYDFPQDRIRGLGQSARFCFVSAIEFDPAKQVPWIEQGLHEADLIDTHAKKKPTENPQSAFG